MTATAILLLAATISATTPDLFIGSSGLGHVSPAATYPFGAIQAGPDTSASPTNYVADWAHTCGYQHGDTHLWRFSQNRFMGIGCGTMGFVGLLPGVTSFSDALCSAEMDKPTEVAEPGYYAVTLKNGIRCEVSALAHTAAYRFTFTSSRHAYLLVDADWGIWPPKSPTCFGRCVYDGAVKLVAPAEARIHCRQLAWNEVSCWAVAHFSSPVLATRRIQAADGKNGEIWEYDFGVLPNGVLDVRLGLSHQSILGAERNLAAEMPRFDFASARRTAGMAWAHYLNRITLAASTPPEVRRIFEAAYYRTLIHPSDLGDGRVSAYSNMSLWDIFRACAPLQTLVAPDKTAEMVRSMVAIYERQGYLPILHAGGAENHCMVGHHAVPIIVDNILKGLVTNSVDVVHAYAAIRDSLTREHVKANDATWGLTKEDWDILDRYGYYPFDKMRGDFRGKVVKGESVSRTLECAYDDACAARLAAHLGHAEDADFFSRRAANWRHVFDASIGFMRGRASDGTWRTPFDPKSCGAGPWADNDFTEGNAWQYTWHVMHDVEGLVAAMGGKRKFGLKLDALFAASSEVYGPSFVHDVSGLVGQYAHGNEPSHHVAYLYRWSDRPARTDEMVHRICTTLYKSTPDGCCGNDDSGQMAAWYVFSALGFYPVDACGGTYIIGAPQVPGATLVLPNGKALDIVVHNFGAPHVLSVTFNDQPIVDWKLHHADLIRGGILAFTMGTRNATPKIVAHRGAGDLTMGEATCAAYSNAVETACDIVKLDVQQTRDEVIVMGHDLSLRRTAGLDVKIADCDYAAIKVKCPQIVRLDEALEMVKSIPEFWLDFKAFTPAMAERALAAFDRAGIASSRIMVATFNKAALEYFRDHHSAIRRVGHISFWQETTQGETRWVHNATPPGHSYATPQEGLRDILAYRDALKLFGVNMPIANGKTSRDDIAFLKQQGLWVSLWFVQHNVQAAQFRDAGADAFVTDHVSRLFSPSEGKRPYEMVRAGRGTDAFPPLARLESACGWRVECAHAEAAFTTVTDRALFGDSVVRLTYRATGSNPVVRLIAPKPIPLAEAADTQTLWVYGNNVFGHDKYDAPYDDVPCVHLFANYQCGTTNLSHSLGFVYHKDWHLLVGVNPIPADACFTGFTITGGVNRTDQAIDLTSFCAFRDPKRPSTVKPRAKRGVQLFATAPQGQNTGVGRLPFPTCATTIIPPSVTLPAKLEFRLPRNPADWNDLAFRYAGSDWVPLAQGGGILPRALPPGAKVNFHPEQNSLVCDIISPTPGITSVRFGTFDVPGASFIPWPFYTLSYYNPVWDPAMPDGYTRHYRPRTAMLSLGGRTLFVGAMFDWTQSNASTVYYPPMNAVTNRLNSGLLYEPKTDGTRNGCFERLVWTFSENVTDVLPVIPNPPSPHKNVTGSHSWAVCGARVHERDVAYWRAVKAAGMHHVLITDHETLWRDDNESFTFRTEAAPRKGGDAAQAAYARTLIDTLGFRYGPYNNFTDYAPVNAHWSIDHVTRCSDGRLYPGWNRCYSPKSTWAVEMCAALTPIIQRKFGFNTAYCDVHTAIPPWGRTDFDAREPGAGTFAQVFYNYGEIMLLQKQAWQGPVYSEGGIQWIYSGLTDGNYARDDLYDFDTQPWLVDFDLLRIHPLCCNFGFFGKMSGKHTPQERRDRMTAATLAFGHPGFFPARRKGDDLAIEKESYFPVQAIAAHYTLADAIEIRYADAQGALHPVSQALANGAVCRSQLRIRYSDGTVVAVNGHCTENFRVSVGGVSYLLPPNGWRCETADKAVISYRGLENNKVVRR